MKNLCNNCFHQKVCKYKEQFQELINCANVLIDQPPLDVDLDSSILITAFEFDIKCNNYSDKNSPNPAIINVDTDEYYMDGVKSAIYEIMKELDVFGSSEIRDSGLSTDDMCARAAEKIRDSYKNP